MVSWLLAVFFLIQPAAATPWANTYETTAQAFARVVASEPPLFEGEDGRERTAALLASWAWFESRFQVDAVGDHGRSFGLFQIQPSNFGPGVTKERMLAEPELAAREFLRLVRVSMRGCRSLKLEERGAWYASGTCAGGRKESAHRFRKAFWLFAHVPRESRRDAVVIRE